MNKILMFRASPRLPSVSQDLNHLTHIEIMFIPCLGHGSDEQLAEAMGYWSMQTARTNGVESD